MKPLGSITIYFPFLDEQTRNTLETMMDNSYNYADFLTRLTEHVLEIDSPPLMVFYAVVQLHVISKSIELILKKYHDISIIQPFIKEFEVAQDEATTTDVIDSAYKVIENTDNPWIKLEMYGLRLFCQTTDSSEDITIDETLNNLEALLQSDPSMRCFEPRYLGALRGRIIGDSTTLGKLDISEKEISKALACDDLYLARNAYIRHAYLLRNSDTTKAHEFLDNAKAMSEKLGLDIDKEWSYHNIRASVHNARGEYSNSIKLYEESIQRKESQTPRDTLRFLPLNLSYIYAEMGDGESALEWAKMALSSRKFLAVGPLFMPMALSRMARALVLVGDFEKAEQFLEKSETEVLKIASESITAENHIVSGYIEIARGDYEAAIFQFERGLEIAERIGYQNRINSCMIGLVRAEIALHESDASFDSLDTSGPWMRLMKSEVIRKDLPGIHGILLLLIAEFRLKQGRIHEARDLISELNVLAQTPGLNYLTDMAAPLTLKIK
ncbi:MAG: tetratricopeptide repeat protein [Candidatus Thorarchaeota archaeon]